MIKSVLTFLVVVCSIAAPVSSHAGGNIVRMSDGQTVSFPQTMADVQSSDVTLIGETHDNTKHHGLQLDVIRSFREKKVPLAIGVEMFQADYQKQLDDWTEGSISEQNFKEIYARNWSYDWSLYREIFLFARDNRIPMVALNVPKEIVFKVARKGFDSLTPEERKNLPGGITCDINKPQTEFLKRTFQNVFGHDASGKVFTSFCEAQAVRNNGMAILITDYLKRNPGRKLVVLAGTWHAVKHGIPDRLRESNSVSFKVLQPEINELGTRNATLAITDYLIER
ncbi:MAG: ChaN family lipoprotein [Desulfuromonadaceae bacterium]|nr:ChaN family lipoprotein [Desulfuromonadaceae bacterium]